MIRLSFALGGGVLTIGAIALRVYLKGFLRGVAEHFAYMTQWGIMLATTYFSMACLSYFANRRPARLKTSVASRRMLLRLHTLGLCFEVTIFLMWLCVAL